MLGGTFAPITTIMFQNLTFAGALSLLSGLVYKPFVVSEL
jgi:hypothetical protein